MLLDELMPVYDVRIRHERLIAAPRGRVWLAARSITIRSLLRVRLLLWLREIFSRLSGLPLEQFPVIAEQSGTEVVRAICGPLWAWRGNIEDIPPDQIPAYSKPGRAKSYWNFHLEDAGRGQTLLTTETRVVLYGPSAQRNFRLYWFFVSPFAAWIRMQILRRIEVDALR